MEGMILKQEARRWQAVTKGEEVIDVFRFGVGTATSARLPGPPSAGPAQRLP